MAPEVLDKITSDIKTIRRRGQAIDVFAADQLMKAFVDKWQPAGKTLDDVESQIGNADSSTEGKISYFFENGEFGWEWSFRGKSRIVVEVERTSVN